MSKTLRLTCLSGLLLLGALSCATRNVRTTPPGDDVPPTAAPTHPLDVWTPAEFERALALLREQGHVSDTTLFPQVVPMDPSKQELEAFQPGAPFHRRLRVVAYEPAKNETYEAIVQLMAPARVERWTLVPGVQPSLTTWDGEQARELILKDERFQKALRRRGVDDPAHVYFDTWAMGPSMDPQRKTHRLMKTLFFFKGDTVYVYARPMEGLIALVDLTTREVVELTDRGDVPIPKGVGAYDDRSVGPLRPRPHPVVLELPEGDNLSLTGNEVRWQNWRFRVESHPREGAVLHTVTYADQGQERKVLHRASLSEMVVPYGDPEDTWSWRSAFDVGEYGFAGRASPLDPGSDVPVGTHHFLPSVYVTPRGKAEHTPRAIALYERDGGVLWKHFAPEQKHNESRRSIELVVAFCVTIENYDYLFEYVFKQDGSMKVDVVLTGIMLARGVQAPTQAPSHAEHAAHDEAYGHRVAPDVVAIHHQHFFNFRLDFDVDGPLNSVLELNSTPLPAGQANAQGNAFSMRMEPLPSELQARREMSLAQGRKWLVINPGQLNGLGQPTGYALLPGENSLPFATPENVSRRRAGFIDHALWATRHAPEELSAAGPFPNQSQGGDGLPTWVKEDQSLVNEDVVLWYTLGVTHIPRPEEWPVMPSAHAGFQLVPVGFFARNPALDVPSAPRP